MWIWTHRSSEGFNGSTSYTLMRTYRDEPTYADSGRFSEKNPTNQLNYHIDPWDQMAENGTESSHPVLRKLTKYRSQNKSERKNNWLLLVLSSLLLQLNWPVITYEAFLTNSYCLCPKITQKSNPYISFLHSTWTTAMLSQQVYQ